MAPMNSSSSSSSLTGGGRHLSSVPRLQTGHPSLRDQKPISPLASPHVQRQSGKGHHGKHKTGGHGASSPKAPKGRRSSSPAHVGPKEAEKPMGRVSSEQSTVAPSDAPTAQGEAPWPDDTARAIKKAFALWDTDGSGTISKAELEQVMRNICPMSDEEIDMLMDEADANGDGVIEYSEFVDWLTKPAKQSYGRAILDYSAILRPLFQVYDRNGCGAISFDDFEECHAILQNSLKLHPQQDSGALRDPLNLGKDAAEAFRAADRSQDGYISYTDFVSWMRDHLDTQGMSGSELSGFTSKLAKILSGIFHLNKMAGPSGCLGSEEEALLGRLVENLARATADFEHAIGEIPDDEREKKPTVWTAPPVGLSIQRLKGQHMRLFPVSSRNVESVECDVLCVPTHEGAKEPEKRIWVAEVVRIVVYMDGKRNVDSPQHYMYDREYFRWVPMQSSQDYEAALDRLPSELAVFCILKTLADFGVKMNWSAVLKGLKSAVDMDLITGEQRSRYVKHMEDKVMQLLIEDGPLRLGRATSSPLEQRCKEVLKSQLKLRPNEVMGTLSKLKIVRSSTLWTELDD